MFVYDVTDEEYLKKLETVLQEQLSHLKASCEIDSGLTVLKSATPTTKKLPEQFETTQYPISFETKELFFRPSR